jgi:hypothetical protein
MEDVEDVSIALESISLVQHFNGTMRNALFEQTPASTASHPTFLYHELQVAHSNTGKTQDNQEADS